MGNECRVHLWQIGRDKRQLIRQLLLIWLSETDLAALSLAYSHQKLGLQDEKYTTAQLNSDNVDSAVTATIAILFMARQHWHCDKISTKGGDLSKCHF